MSTTLGWIFWTIGVVTLLTAFAFVCNSDEKKVVKGWLLLTLGLFSNAIACIVEHDNFSLSLSILIGLWDFSIYLKRKKEYERKMKEKELEYLNSKEAFIEKINDYKK